MNATTAKIPATWRDGSVGTPPAASSRAGLQIEPPVNSLLEEIKALEVELHHPGARCPLERLQQLLHPEFHEVGRGGRIYDRETTLGYLYSPEARPPVVSDSFEVSERGSGVVLLTYRSAQLEIGDELSNHTLRSSVWVKAAGRWQLCYHQGTPAAQTW